MKSIIMKLFWSSIAIAILGALFTFGTITYFTMSLPKIESLADYYPAMPSKILSSDGTVLAKIGRENRELVSIEDVPQRIIDAFLAAEDAGFYEHAGVDYLGVLRALIINIKAGRVVQGGSTITQQVAKSLLLTKERSITRKIKDFLLAQKIEERFSKIEILYLYLNQVYLGGGYYGVKVAFRGYYDKEMSEVTIAEAAMVAGLLVAPGKYSPYVNPQYAKKRQHYVLKRMWKNNKITESQYRDSLDENIKFRLRKKTPFKAGYFTDWIRQIAIDVLGEDRFLRDGLVIQTTINWKLQKIAEKEVLLGAKRIDKRQGFKGPLRSINKKEVAAEMLKFQVKVYKEKSHYFTLDEDLKRVYELAFDAEKFNQTTELLVSRDKQLRRVIAGNVKESPMINLLDLEKDYKAIVLKVNNSLRMIFISLGGVRGIIPFDHFKWAHVREISKDSAYYGYVVKPSSILKVGDEILVNILKKETNILKNVYKPKIEQFQKSKDYELTKDDNYLLCNLDQVPEAQAALVSMQPHTGDVVAFVGGSNFGVSQFNRAIQSKRQPGSSFKPILYAAGLENGYTPASIIIDSPETLAGVDESLNWKPRNYDGKFKGPMTFRNSLEQSRNVTTIKIADNIGVPKILDFVKRLGIKSELDKDLSIALGSFGMTLLDMVSVYSIFPNGGKLVTPKYIVSVLDRTGADINFAKLWQDKKDSKLGENDLVHAEAQEQDEEITKAKGQQLTNGEKGDGETAEKINQFHQNLNELQVYDKRLAYLMTNLLRGVVLHGTGRRAREVSLFLGGKTGTTNNYVDAWFLGFSSNLVTGVWSGMDDNKTMGWGETGAKSALPIWKEFMRAGLKYFGEYDFKQPSGIVNININKQTGALASAEDGEAFLEAFVEGTGPDAEVNIENVSDDEIENKQFIDDDEYFENQ